MGEFVRYHHVERLGTTEVEGIEVGQAHVFPKLDGANASIWERDGSLRAGSRNRELSLERDNAGFLAWAVGRDELLQAVVDHPDWVIYGEWLVPHTFKAYREDAWKRFWVFDVYSRITEKLLHYDEYSSVLRELGLDVIEPLAIVTNGSDDRFVHLASTNTYLVQDGGGAGEGVVIKNYAYTNRFGRQCWAKVVRNEFKEENRRAFGVTEIGDRMIEAEIAEYYVTPSFVAKERAKIQQALWEEHLSAGGPVIDSRDVWDMDAFIGTREARSKLIPRLLETVFHELVREETYDIVKRYRGPTIDFRKLRAQVVYRTKLGAADLF